MFNASHLVEINKIAGGNGHILYPSTVDSLLKGMLHYSTYASQVVSVARIIMQDRPFLSCNKSTGILFLLAAFAEAGVVLNKTDEEWKYFAQTSVVQRWPVAHIVSWLYL